jgi:transcriptional regulator with XRE-family HTH domain
MRERRESLGVSQGRLGRHLGLTFSQVQKYEKGTNRISAGRLYLLASYLRVPIQYFFEGLGEAQRAGNGSAYVKSAELALLDDAFQSIADRETRQTLLALVRSVAASAELGGGSSQSRA